MPKPCLHTDSVPGCSVCHHADTNPEYRRLWGVDEPVVVAVEPGLWEKAKNFGKAAVQHVLTGLKTLPEAETQARLAVCAACPQFDSQRRVCKKCGCGMDRKASWPEQQCPEDRWPKAAPEPTPKPANPFTGEVIRHLAYFIAPASGSGSQVWRRNLDQVMARAAVFNGRRLIAIATGGGIIKQQTDGGAWVNVPLESPEVVRDYLVGFDCEFLEIVNDPNRQESAALVPMLEKLETTNPNEVIFVAHAKGVTRPVNPGVSVHRWTDMMYETNLDYYPLAMSQLERFPCTGSFKKAGDYLFGTPALHTDFHYSGSFYWLRSNELFKRDWRNVYPHWAGYETYPPQIFKCHEADCLFWDGTGVINLYDVYYLLAIVEPGLREWKLKNREHRAMTAAVEGLNLGCGAHPAPGWVNADVAETDEIRPDVLLIPGQPLPFKTGEFARAYLGHVLEHISWEELPSFLKQIKRVVKPGGQILIVGPDILRLLASWRQGPTDDTYKALMIGLESDEQYQLGTPDRPGARHHWNCDEARLLRLLNAEGFTEAKSLPIAERQEGWLMGWPVVSFAPGQCAVLATVSSSSSLTFHTDAA